MNKQDMLPPVFVTPTAVAHPHVRVPIGTGPYR